MKDKFRLGHLPVCCSSAGQHKLSNFLPIEERQEIFGLNSRISDADEELLELPERKVAVLVPVERLKHLFGLRGAESELALKHIDDWDKRNFGAMPVSGKSSFSDNRV